MAEGETVTKPLNRTTQGEARHLLLALTLMAELHVHSLPRTLSSY